MSQPPPIAIVSAAVQFNGRIYQGKRHAQIMRQIWDEQNELVKITQDQQGFMTSEGEFVNRFQAGAIAFISGQTGRRHQNLLSEHLWTE